MNWTAFVENLHNNIEKRHKLAKISDPASQAILVTVNEILLAIEGAVIAGIRDDD